MSMRSAPGCEAWQSEFSCLCGRSILSSLGASRKTGFEEKENRKGSILHNFFLSLDILEKEEWEDSSSYT